MKTEKIKTCPFKNDKCTDDCALYINPDDLNETVRNRLASIGVIERNTGICALKNLSLGISRQVYENNSSYSR